MKETASTSEVKTTSFWMQVCDDPFNKRIRIDDYYGNIRDIIAFAEELAKSRKIEKLIMKVRTEHFNDFLMNGHSFEAKIANYYFGTDCNFFTKYFNSTRLFSSHWVKEDEIISKIQGLPNTSNLIEPPSDYKITKMQMEDAEGLASLYQKVFEVYPTPLHNPDYIKKTMLEGTVYYGYYYNGKIVSAASAEINHKYHNAELTDCATLPEHRKHGLMKVLLVKLEEELYRQRIFCSYSIARSLSYGMNAVLHQLGYDYSGRLKNNVMIYDKMEDMNVWVKNLAARPNFRH